MNNGNNIWSWSDFQKAMSENMAVNERESSRFLLLVEKCDKTVSGILDRPLSYAHRKPQDFVVALMITRSFRLALSAIHLALIGYPDGGPNLLRTIWEINIWFNLIQNDPIGASIGYLVVSAESKINMWEHDLQCEHKKKQYSSNLEKNLANWKNYMKTLQEIASSHRLSIEEINSKYKYIKFSRIHKNLGLEHKYNTFYRFMSGFVHEMGYSNDVFLDESQSNTRGFLLGPSPSGCIEIIHDALDLLILNLIKATEIIGEKELEKQCEKIHEELSSIWSQACNNVKLGD